MSIEKASIPLPAQRRTSSKASQYKFEELRPGTTDCFLEFDYDDAEKVRGRLTSATVAWRKRTGSKQKFTVREVEVPRDGVNVKALGVWALAEKAAPAATEQAAEAAAA